MTYPLVLVMVVAMTLGSAGVMLGILSYQVPENRTRSLKRAFRYVLWYTGAMLLADLARYGLNVSQWGYALYLPVIIGFSTLRLGYDEWLRRRGRQSLV